jgi:prepilin-type N-terminal cleavage/methylation domain-containing protein
MKHAMNIKRRNAFTLIELLTVVAVIAVLAGLALPVLGRIVDGGQQAAEVSAARALIAGYLSHAADNNNQLMPGYKKPEAGTTLKDGPDGNLISHSEAQQRYAWRLAPYLDYDIGTLLVGNARYAPPDDGMYHYLVSVYTVMGMNTSFVGGHFGGSGLINPSNPRTPPGAIVKNLHQAAKPGKLIVFASAAMEQDGYKSGNFYVLPPKLRSGGGNNVDFRWNEKAIVACLDGHVELLDREGMNDMRRWSNLAAIADDPDSSGLR